MKGDISINKAAAPKDWGEFKRWYKAACSSLDLSAEDAYKSLGYKVPVKKKDVSRSDTPTNETE